jgi:hypothetical protein
MLFSSKQKLAHLIQNGKSPMWKKLNIQTTSNRVLLLWKLSGMPHYQTSHDTEKFKKDGTVPTIE